MTYKDDIQEIISELNTRAAKAIAREISISFVIGWNKSGTKKPITALEQNAIKELTRVNLGYIQEFNAALGKQLESTIADRIAKGGDYESIRKDIIPTIRQTFGDSGTVTIDRTGQLRQQIEVMPDGSLRRVDKVITRPYSTTVEAYSDLLARTTAHSAIEKGRRDGYRSQGVKQWRFVGPADERARQSHVLLIGNVYEYGTVESDMALEILDEPFCRHRQIPYHKDDESELHYSRVKERYFEQQQE